MGTDKVTLLDDSTLQAFKTQYKMDKDFAVGMVGRIEEHKGQHLLIEALATLEGVSAFFVGHEMKEGYIETLKEQAKALGIEERVHFLGFMKDPMHFMQACDAMVLATPCETFGLVVIEAMSVGTPVIATKACGPLEIIEDGVNGLLFEKRDTADLSSKIKVLVQDENFLNKIKVNAIDSTNHKFETGIQFEKLKKLFGEVV